MKIRPGPAAGGFTLLEALAAVLTLGLLAAAVVPMLRQLGRIDLSERIQAQSYLASITSQDGLVAGPALTVAGHPGWRLVISSLNAGPEPAPPPGAAPPAGPAHRWLLVGIHASDGGETLAETLVAALDAGARP